MSTKRKNIINFAPATTFKHKIMENSINAIDLLLRVKDEEGNVITVWSLDKIIWSDGLLDGANENPLCEENLGVFFDDRDAAVKAMKEVADDITPEFGVCTEVILSKANVSIDDLDDIDWDKVEKHDDSYGNSVLNEMFLDNSCIDENVSVAYDYKPVNGALLIFWSWNTHVGYARDLREIREGMSGEDETLCIKQDKTFVTQCDVLIEEQELEGLSREDRRALIEKRLGENHWKWTPRAESYIRVYLRDFC